MGRSARFVTYRGGRGGSANQSLRALFHRNGSPGPASREEGIAASQQERNHYSTGRRVRDLSNGDLHCGVAARSRTDQGGRTCSHLRPRRSAHRLCACGSHLSANTLLTPSTTDPQAFAWTTLACGWGSDLGARYRQRLLHLPCISRFSRGACSGRIGLGARLDGTRLCGGLLLPALDPHVDECPTVRRASIRLPWRCGCGDSSAAVPQRPVDPNDIRRLVPFCSGHDFALTVDPMPETCS